MYEYFEKLLNQYGVTTYQVAKATGISTASFSGWKNGKWNFKQEKLQRIADFFGVPLQYLLTGENECEIPQTSLTPKDEKDISIRIERALKDLEDQQQGLMFDGEPMDDNTRELLKASLENSIRVAKINAKKFTAKKYRKNAEED